MITFLSENLIHFYFAFLVLMFGGCAEGCRRLIRRDRIVRGIRP